MSYELKIFIVWKKNSMNFFWKLISHSLLTYNSKYWFIFLNDFLFKQSLVEIFETFEKYSSIILREIIAELR